MSHLKKSNIDYLNMSDEEILSYVHSGCEQGMEHLIERYKPLVRAKARSYFLVGADREDIVQEGMIGCSKQSEITGMIKKFPSEYSRKCVLPDKSLPQ